MKTAADFNNETPAQEIFDFVVNHLQTQGKKATSANSIQCMYRAPDGSKCAAGCLITDEEYDPSMEGTTFGGVKLINITNRLGNNAILVLQLQSVHDSYNVPDWEGALARVAIYNGLRFGGLQFGS